VLFGERVEFVFDVPDLGFEPAELVSASLMVSLALGESRVELSEFAFQLGQSRPMQNGVHPVPTFRGSWVGPIVAARGRSIGPRFGLAFECGA